jgi:hypothetical protein
VLPETNVRLLIFIEGKHDIPFLMNMADMLIRGGVDVPNLRQLEQDGKIIFAPLGGQNLLLWANRTAHLLKPEFHLSDRDNAPPDDPKYKDLIDGVMARAGTGEPVYATCTARREMENYIPVSAIQAALAANGFPQIARVNEYAPFDDVPTVLTAEMNAVLPAHARWKQATAKAFLNTQAVPHMTPADLTAIDPGGEVVGWFNKIGQMMQ